MNISTKEDERIALFIDGANFYAAARALGRWHAESSRPRPRTSRFFTCFYTLFQRFLRAISDSRSVDQVFLAIREQFHTVFSRIATKTIMNCSRIAKKACARVANRWKISAPRFAPRSEALPQALPPAAPPRGGARRAVLRGRTANGPPSPARGFRRPEGRRRPFPMWVENELNHL